MSEKTATNADQRMDPEHVFRFRCAPDLPCFTRCCQDVTIVLTPYDVLRMKNSLQISSAEFLDKYTVIIPKENRLIPMVAILMGQNDKRCPFVAHEGCRIYKDRPWACRMYPLDMNDDGTFRIIAESSSGPCLGLQESAHSRIGDWLVDQGMPIYDEMNRLLSEITNPLRAQDLDIDNPAIYKMVFMALYNLDRFRDFVLTSSLLQKFDIDPILVEKIKRSDLELLKFAYDWIKFGLFGQKTMRVKPEAAKSPAPQQAPS